jgi:hypothetical protein
VGIGPHHQSPSAQPIYVQHTLADIDSREFEKKEQAGLSRKRIGTAHRKAALIQSNRGSNHHNKTSPSITYHQQGAHMKHVITLLGVLIFVLTLTVSNSLFSQEKKKSAKKMPSQEEMMKRWQESMTPGSAHKMLEESVGTWDAEVKMWMNGPGSEPMVSKGASEQKMVLGGRYLQQDFSGEMMGQPFNGTGFTGYDNFKKKYVSFWIDNMSTAMSTMDGVLDKDGKSVTMWGKMNEPATGEKDKKIKYVTRFADNDTQIFETYDVSAYGDKKPTMQITYKRRK